MAEASLYEMLGVGHEATAGEIKKAYHQLAMQLHPDKNPDPESHVRFQDLQRVYSILSDPAKRKVYDRSGSAEGLDAEDLAEWTDFFRSLVPEITTDMIDDFVTTYRGSEEEETELLELYRRFQGDMKQVMEWQIGAEEAEDAFRFKSMIQKAIKAKVVKAYPAFEAWASKVTKPKSKRRKRPAAASSMDLVAQIRGKSRQSQHGGMDSLVQSLADKYGVGDQVGDMQEPSEEEFERARKRMSKK